MSWYTETDLKPWEAQRHLREIPDLERAHVAEAAAARITMRTARRKVACERGWATRCRKIIAMWLPYVDG